MSENRRFSRIPFHTSSLLRHGNQEVSTDLLDISLKGALVRKHTSWTPTQGDADQLTLQLGSSEFVIRADVELMHVGEDCLGYRFKMLDLDSIIHLRRLMELNMGDATLVERELHQMM